MNPLSECLKILKRCAARGKVVNIKMSRHYTALPPKDKYFIDHVYKEMLTQRLPWDDDRNIF